VIKNQPAYYHQARVEIGLLQFLNARCDPNDTHHIVRMIDFFLFRKHLCLVFEKLDVNLFELLKRNSFRGLSLSLVQVGAPLHLLVTGPGLSAHGTCREV
jgi:dual specificity protein kinase YAK1